MLAALTPKPCFKNCREQGFGGCCLLTVYIAVSERFCLKSFCITYLTSYHWTLSYVLHKNRAEEWRLAELHDVLTLFAIWMISSFVTGPSM